MADEPELLDALSATEVAIFRALDAGISGAAVFQHAPEDTEPPVVIVGDIDKATPIGASDDPDRRIPLTIVVITEGEQRRPCLLLIGQVEKILSGATLSAGGFTIRPCFDNSTAVLAEDGASYVGLCLFEVLAFSDD